MRRKQQMLQLAMALVLAASFLAPWGAVAEQAKPSQPAKAAPSPADPTIATVNGARICESDLKMGMGILRRNMGKTEQSPEETLGLRKMALQQLIGFELLYQDSLSLGIEDLEKQIDQMIATAEKQSGSPEKFQEQLKQEGLTMERVRKNIRRNLLVQAEVEKRVVPKVKVTEADIQAFYQASQDQLKHEELVGARHILVRVPQGATEEQKKAAQEKIASVRKELTEGKDFAQLAKENSDCPSKERGGDLGYFPKGVMAPEFEKAAFSLKEGELSEIVETQFGYHLIQVYGKKPAGTWPLEEVRGQMENDLKDKKIWEAVNAYMQELEKKAKIKILDKTLAETAEK